MCKSDRFSQYFHYSFRKLCAVCVLVCVYEGSALRGQKKVPDALELVTGSVGAGDNTWSSGRAGRAVKCLVILSVPFRYPYVLVTFSKTIWFGLCFITRNWERGVHSSRTVGVVASHRRQTHPPSLHTSFLSLLALAGPNTDPLGTVSLLFQFHFFSPRMLLKTTANAI